MQSSAETRKNLHIAIDLDDVVLDFMPSVMASFAREYGEQPVYDGCPWGQQAVEFGKHPLFLASGYKSWWDWLRDREWLWANFPVINGAIGGIKRLRHAGHYVECVTAKPTWAEHNVWKWLGKWRPAFNRVTVVTNGQKKVDFTNAYVMVDDKLETCVDFVRSGRVAVWFNRANAPSQAYNDSIKIARNWEEVLKAIEEFSYERGA